MAIKTKWRRALLPAEKRVDFKQLGDQWASAENALIDDLTPALVQVMDKLEKDLRAILDSGKYADLKDIRIGYKDKLVGIFKSHMFDAFKFGKLGVHQEFDIKIDFAFDTAARDYLILKAEAVVTDLLDKIKANAVFTVLNGIKANYTTDQILKEVKGPAFKSQQAEAKK